MQLRWVCCGCGGRGCLLAPTAPPNQVQSVGKTSIITRFMYDKFDTTYQVRSLGEPLCGPTFDWPDGASRWMERCRWRHRRHVLLTPLLSAVVAC